MNGTGIEGFRPVPQDAPVVGREEPDLVRTALCVEPRDGIIHVFFPPLYAAEDWLELTAAIEETAAEFGRKVVLEGYLPPRGPAPDHISPSRPIPGVIEVNIHPAASWARDGASAPSSSTRKRARSGWRRRNSCSTAAMSAPAAATMW